MKKQENDAVVVVWRSSEVDENGDFVVAVLSYGDGSARKFKSGKTDPRCGEVARFETANEVFEYLTLHGGPEHPCELRIEHAARLGVL